MKKYMLKGAMAAVCGAAMLTSCHDNDMFDPASVAQKYADNWVKTYGEIDPNQDWNLAKSGTLNINVAGTGNVVARVYSGNPHEPGEISLLAKYNLSAGENHINFDFPDGMTQVYVSVSGSKGFVGTECVGIGGTVTFGADAASAPAKAVAKVATRTAAAGSFEITDYRIFTENEVRQIVENLPEEKSAVDKFNDYEFVSNGEFVIYPVYGQTIAKDTIGYYYYNPDNGETIANRKEVAFIDDLQNLDDTVLLVTKPSTKYQEGENIWWEDGATTEENYVWNSGDTRKNLKTVEYEWKKTEYFIKAKGYAINIPAGYRVGFWIKNGDNKLYSNRTLNDDGLYYSAVKTHQNGDMYFGLEDWKQNGDNHSLDCNDIVFFVKGSGNVEPPMPVTPDKPQSWIIACEDLGSTDDFDFNDVVFEVSYASGTTKATVTPMAAGGVYSAIIGRINTNGNLTKIGEIHELLGKAGVDGKQAMMNTGLDDGYTGTPVTIDVPEDFSLAYSNDGGWTANMGGFYIEVKSNMTTKVTITGSTEGKAPQMLLLPGSWKWPNERVNIEKAYPNFTGWSAAGNTNVDWYSYPEYGDGTLIYGR